jgi:hypothetical protein
MVFSNSNDLGYNQATLPLFSDLDLDKSSSKSIVGYLKV